MSYEHRILLSINPICQFFRGFVCGQVCKVKGLLQISPSQSPPLPIPFSQPQIFPPRPLPSPFKSIPITIPSQLNFMTTNIFD